MQTQNTNGVNGALMTQLRSLIDALLRMPPDAAAAPDAVNARAQALEHLTQRLRDFSSVGADVNGLVLWCVSLLNVLPVPSIGLPSYKDLINYRSTNPLVQALIQLLIVAIKSPQLVSLKPGLPPAVSNSVCFIHSIYDIAALRWLLFCVVQQTPEYSLMYLHLLSAERLFDVGNPVFESVRTQGAPNTNHAVVGRIHEYLNVIGEFCPDQLAESLKDLFFTHYVDGLTQTVRAGLDNASAYKRKMLSFFMTTVLLFPQILPLLIPKLSSHLSTHSQTLSLYKIALMESIHRFSIYKPFPQTNQELFVFDVVTMSLEFLLKSGLMVIAPQLCEIFCAMEEVHSVAKSTVNLEVERKWFQMGVPVDKLLGSKLMLQVQTDIILMRIIDLLQDFALTRDREGPNAPTSHLMSCFTSAQLSRLCQILATRCDQEQQTKRITQTQVMSAANNNIPQNIHLVLLLELYGLVLGKQAAFEIFVYVIRKCARPCLGLPLDPVTLRQSDLGELNSVHIVGSLRLAWKAKEGANGTADAYKLALETLVKKGEGSLPLDETTVTNLWYLVLLKDEVVIHADRDITTKYILAPHWANILQLSIPKTSSLPASSQINLLRILHQLIPTVLKQTTLAPTTSLLLPSLLDTFFSVLTDLLLSIVREKQHPHEQSGEPNVKDSITYLHTLSHIIASSVSSNTDGEPNNFHSAKSVFVMLLSRVLNFELSIPEGELWGGTGPSITGNAMTGVVMGQSGNSTPASIARAVSTIPEIPDKQTSILDALRQHVSGGLVGGDDGPAILFMEKKEFRRQNSDVLEKRRKKEGNKVEKRFWAVEFDALVSYLIGACCDEIGVTGPFSLAEALHEVLELRPVDGPPVALASLAQSQSDTNLISKFKSHPVLWESMMLIANDSNAYIYMKDVIRAHASHLSKFYTRTATITKPFPDEAVAIEWLIRVVARAHIGVMGSADAILLLPVIGNSEKAVLVTALWEVSESEYSGHVKQAVKKRKYSGGEDMDISHDDGNSAETRAKLEQVASMWKETLLGIVTRNVVTVGVDLACMFYQ